MENYLHASEATSAAVSNLFMGTATGISVIGGWLADGFLGQFSTIVWGTLIMCLGGSVIPIANAPGLASLHTLVAYAFYLGLGLLVFGIGMTIATGSAFVGDQFLVEVLNGCGCWSLDGVWLGGREEIEILLVLLLCGESRGDCLAIDGADSSGCCLAVCGVYCVDWGWIALFSTLLLFQERICVGMGVIVMSS